MLRKYCLENSSDWDEGVPFVLFAAREAIQDSLGFSPAQLVFGHTPGVPLKTLYDQFMSLKSSPAKNVFDYVSHFRERLHIANAFVKQSLSGSQEVMKRHYDRSAVTRCFHPGDLVLAILPTPASVLSAKFTGPYEVRERLSDTNYILSTPERR